MVRSKFAISIHVMTFLAKYSDEWVTSARLAKSLNINPVLVRKDLSVLKENGLIVSKEGPNGGVKTSRTASEIKLSEIFLICKGDEHILGFSKNAADPTCVIGSNIKENLGKIYSEMDQLIEGYLVNMTLEEFKEMF